MPAASKQKTVDALPRSLDEGIRPVVILGAGRSGTKFLRRVIASSSACAAIPYGVSYAWRYGNERSPHDALPAAACTPHIARHVRASLLRLSDLSKDRRLQPGIRYLVEKTCANTLRVAFVHTILPDARYVHLVRDGRDVVASAYCRWTTRPDLRPLLKKLYFLGSRDLTVSNLTFVGTYVQNWARNLMRGKTTLNTWGPRYRGMAEEVQRRSLLDVCAQQWRTCVESALHDLHTLAEERTLFLRYEQLVHDPATIDQICSFLQLPDPGAVKAYYRSTVRRDAVGKGRRALRASSLEQIAPIVTPLLERLGYE